MSRVNWSLIIVLAMGAFSPSQGQSLFGDPGQSLSLFQDRKPRRAGQVGDILTVLITETTSASNSSSIETSKESSTDISSNKGTGALKFIPGLGLGSEATTEYTGEGAIARSQQIQARVSVTVVGLKANGDLMVEGSRVIEINGEQEIIYLSGSVNPKIIPASNVIESFRISDLQVSYKGKGVLQQGTRPGIFVRVLNWIF